jgi:hypothetical protein
MIHQEVVRGLARDRLHDAARRQVRRDTHQQMNMIGTDVPLHDLDVVAPANLAKQVPHLRAHVAAEHRLAILRDEYEVIMQCINGMGGSTILAHRAERIASLLKASPEGEGIHPSQNVTLSASRALRFPIVRATRRETGLNW